MDLIKFVHGEDVNLYTDVLRVNPKASDQEIQSAFVARRYELFNELQSASDTKIVNTPKAAPPGSPMVTLNEKQFTEKKMDALIASYRLLCDSEKRRQYNMSLYLAAAQKSHNIIQSSPTDVRKLSQTPTTSGSMKESSMSSSPSVKKKLFDSSPETEKICDTNFDQDHRHLIGTNDSNDDQSFQSSNVPDSIEDTISNGSWDDHDSNLQEEQKKYNVPKRKGKKETPRSPHMDNDLMECTPQDRKVRWSKSTDNNMKAPRKGRPNINVSNDEDDDESEVEDQIRSKTKSRIIFRKGRSSKKNLMTEVPDESEDSEDNGDGDSGMIASWLRANNLLDQADMIDNISREIAGAAADTVLAFNQILNAFTIDDEAIDSVAGNIVDATEDLETFNS